MYLIINEAARAYDGVIPADCYHQPYMLMEELEEEMKRVTFYVWEESGELIGIMGVEPIEDVTLIRHSYVLPRWQGKGIGSRLLNHIKELVTTSRLLVGTWADARRAIAFYQKYGFRRLLGKDELLQKYWDIPWRQIEASVVLGLHIEKGIKESP
jgi:GNAT superfamily N-acetyltransferase|tara:strand:- start:446 stop:910 length:465 start_codon:yes stop_codon:yes gene_type:complete